MDVSKYFKSLSLELTGLKNRVRNYIEGDHWQTDGEWKESVLRTVLKRHLPDNVKVGRGFILKDRGHSRQIDVLLYDASKPVLFRDGDLVFITDDAVKGIIEVKSNLYQNNFVEVVNKLSDTAEFINDRDHQNDNDNYVFIGLFAYDSNLKKDKSKWILDKVNEVTHNNPHRIINHLTLGDSLFIRYWRTSPYWQKNYNKWHSYDLKDKSYGYFIHNIVYSLSQYSVRLNQDVWFPKEGKEIEKIEDIGFGNNVQPQEN